MIKNLTGAGISKNHNVKVHSISGMTSNDLIDHIKPMVRKNPDAVLVHIGSNDLTDNVNTMKKIKKVVAAIREIDKEEKISISFSSIIERNDIDLEKDFNLINEKIKSYCSGKGFSFIDNSNIDRSCLSWDKLHLNSKGTAYLANNFKKYVSNI